MTVLDLIKKVDVFKNLSVRDINLLGTICRQVEVPSRSMIMQEGKPGAGLFIIEKGSVKVCKNIEGKLHSIANIDIGGHFGEISLIDDGPASASIVTDLETSLLFISRETFSQLSSSNVSLALKIYKNLARTLAQRLRKTSTAVVFKK
ncbi:MAG: cyclic nucleotide-binding domain-containing protein [Pseudomonadota bacterium]